MKQKYFKLRTGTIALFCLLLTGNILAQEQLIIEKNISIEAKEDVQQKLDLLVEWLVNHTNGQIQFRSCNSDKIIVEGDIPLLLDKSPFILSSQFNGNIKYCVDISYSENQIKLHFRNLYHHSTHSINGWDFDMGFLQKNNKVQKEPVLHNFDFLSEDYSRLNRFKTDQQMAQLVCEKTIETIDQTIHQIPWITF
ncbi:MAG: hypothetical protein JEZ14_04940 [Marinilabiliaceae bacterium]|nr:hypothetical protein [Marinilabiliaceae bacterium]